MPHMLNQLDSAMVPVEVVVSTQPIRRVKLSRGMRAALCDMIPLLSRKCGVENPASQRVEAICPAAVLAYCVLSHRARVELARTSAQALAKPKVDQFGQPRRRGPGSSSSLRFGETETELLATVRAQLAPDEVLPHDLARCAWCPTRLRPRSRSARSAVCGMASMVLPTSPRIAFSILALNGIVAETEASPRNPGQPYRQHLTDPAQATGADPVNAVTGDPGSCAYPRATRFARVDPGSYRRARAPMVIIRCATSVGTRGYTSRSWGRPTR